MLPERRRSLPCSSNPLTHSSICLFRSHASFNLVPMMSPTKMIKPTESYPGFKTFLIIPLNTVVKCGCEESLLFSPQMPMKSSVHLSWQESRLTTMT